MNTRKRQLAAIVFTDIVGYSAIMNADEDRARGMRDKHRKVFQECTEKHGGRILQYYGDGTLSVFDSSVEAVESCIAIQQALQEEPKVPLRIGIHSGDIILDQEEIYGDGVNVAARLETACIPGGILISSKVHDDIKNHPDIQTRALGKHLFKNISESFEIFAIANPGLANPSLSEWEEAIHQAHKVSPAKPRGVLPRRANQILISGLAVMGAIALLLSILYFAEPRGGKSQQIASATLAEKNLSIAVLPFANFSDNAENDYFSDGITEDILTMLSRIKGLNVISRTTMMKYKDTKKGAREIGEELGADYILEGSVRRQGGVVRIVAQLIDAKTDNHIWAQTYDRETAEIFQVQSQVATDIASALKMQLAPSGKTEVAMPHKTNVEAYELFLQGRKYYTEYTPKDNDIAIQLFQSALAIDSTFAPAWAGLGDALGQKANRFGKDPALLDSAMVVCRRAIALDPQLSDAHKALGLVYHYQGKYDEAMDAYLEALKHNPSNGMATLNVANIYRLKGELVNAVRWAQKAYHLNPKDRWTAEIMSGMYQALGMYDKSIELLNESLRLYPDFLAAHRQFFYIYLELGNLDKAAYHARQYGVFDPGSGQTERMLAGIELAKGNIRQARNMFEEARTNFPLKAEDNLYWESELAYAFTLRKLGDPKAYEIIRTLRGQVEKLVPKKDQAQYYYVQCLLDAAQGNNESALNNLQQAGANNFLNIGSIQANPVFTDLRSNPRFFEILQTIKVKVDRMRREVELSV
jgi:adenylate cyclase